jgi:L-amino acid N-acyltransferase YncA
MSGPGAARIVAARPGDVAAMAAIYNEVLAASTAIFSDEPITEAEMRARVDARAARGFVTLVALDGERVLGYAGYGEFRSWPGYRTTVEHSVYVAADSRRAGLGRALMDELIGSARAGGMHVMVGAIDAANEASLRLHERLGFVRVGLMPEVARKFDRWLDLALLQLTL